MYSVPSVVKKIPVAFARICGLVGRISQRNPEALLIFVKFAQFVARIATLYPGTIPALEPLT